MKRRADAPPKDPSFAVREAARRAAIARRPGIPSLPMTGVHERLAIVPPRNKTTE